MKGSSPPSGQRTCGNCTACCTHLPIPAGIVGLQAKRPGEACPHLGTRGCRVYTDRPPTCAEFYCAWMQNAAWPERWRPDRCGLLALRERLDGDLFAAAIYEIRPGALERQSARDLLAGLEATSAAVVLVNARGQRLCRVAPAQVARPAIPAPHFTLHRLRLRPSAQS